MKVRTRLLGVSLLTTFGCFSGPGESGSARVGEDARVRSRSAEVYAAVLRHAVIAQGWAGPPRDRTRRRPIEQLVIVDELVHSASGSVGAYVRARLDEADPETLAGFEAATGDVPRGLLELQDVGRYELVTADDMAVVFGDGWDGFYERFPGAPGFVAFSPVGFNQAADQALVLMDHARGRLWGAGVLYLLGRGTDGWRVIDQVTLWES